MFDLTVDKRSGTATLKLKIQDMKQMVTSSNEMTGCWDPDDKYTIDFEKLTSDVYQMLCFLTEKGRRKNPKQIHFTVAETNKMDELVYKPGYPLLDMSPTPEEIPKPPSEGKKKRSFNRVLRELGV